MSEATAISNKSSSSSSPSSSSSSSPLSSSLSCCNDTTVEKPPALRATDETAAEACIMCNRDSSSDGIMRTSSTYTGDSCYYPPNIDDTRRRIRHLRPPYELYLYYFCHGIQEDLPATALYLVLKDSFQLEPAVYSYISCLNWIPWVLKPLFGYLSDTCPIGGKRRSPYISMGILLNLVGWLLLSAYTIIENEVVYIAIMVFSNVATVMSETAVDSLLAEMAREEREGDIGYIQSTVWTWDAAGSVFGATIPIAAFYWDAEPQVLLLLNAGCVAVSALAIPFIREQPLESRSTTDTTTTATNMNTTTSSSSALSTTVTIDKEVASGSTASASGCDDDTGGITNSAAATGGVDVVDVGSGLKECFQNPLLLKALAFVFVVSSSPTSGDAFTYFQTDVLGFSPAFLSWTTVIQTAANFVAAYAYAAFLRTWDMRLVFQNTIVFTMIVGLVNVIVVERWNTYVGIPDKMFVVGDTLAQGVAGEIIFMPVAVLAAHLAPKGREGTVYAIVMSVLNLAWSFSEFLSGALAWCLSIKDGNYDNLTFLILIVSSLTLVPLFFLRCVPELSQLRFEDADTNNTTTSTSTNGDDSISEEEELGSGSSEEGDEAATTTTTNNTRRNMPMTHFREKRRTKKKDNGVYSQVAVVKDDEEMEQGCWSEEDYYIATTRTTDALHQEQQQHDRRGRKTKKKRKDEGVYSQVAMVEDVDMELV